MDLPTPAYENKVFINCPFDEEYNRFLNRIFFTLIYLGYHPEICSALNVAPGRLDIIKTLMENCKYSLHDLSRYQYTEKSPFARFNLPLELGLDLGLCYWGGKQKIVTFMVDKKDVHDIIISDLSGTEPLCHNNDLTEMIDTVKNWFGKINRQSYPDVSVIKSYFKMWKTDYKINLMKSGYPKDHLESHEVIIENMKSWRLNRIKDGTLKYVYVEGKK